MIQQLKDAVSSSKNPDLEFEEVNDYTTTSMGETVKGLITYLITKFIRGVFFICITTRKLVLGEKKEFVTGRTPLLKTMRAMEITEKEATKFFKLFEKIDEDHSGSIEIQEFFDFFKLEMTDFARRAFEVMDFDRAKNSVGSLHYGEFFVSMWNFCTLSHETLVKFTFDLYDTDGSGELSEKEIYNMVRMMRPSSSAKDADRETRKMMVLMDKEDAEIGVKDNMVSFDEFMSAHRKVGTVIFPAFQLQRTIRLKSMSKKFWQQATSKRERLFPTDINDVGTTDLIELYKNFCEEKEEPPEKDEEQDEFDLAAQRDKDEEAQLLLDLEAQKEKIKKEREEWAKNQALEFNDGVYVGDADGVEEKKEGGFMMALAKSKFKSKIYHTPREGSWWSETPDVKGPAVIYGVNGRPNSAKFKTEKTSVYDAEPLVIVERGMADLMSDAYKAKSRAAASIKRAKRSIRSAKGERESIEIMDDGFGKGRKRPWSGLGRRLYDPANIVGRNIADVHVLPAVKKIHINVPKIDTTKIKRNNHRPESARQRKVVDFIAPSERQHTKKKKRPQTAH